MPIFRPHKKTLGPSWFDLTSDDKSEVAILDTPPPHPSVDPLETVEVTDALLDQIDPIAANDPVAVTAPRTLIEPSAQTTATQISEPNTPHATPAWSEPSPAITSPPESEPQDPHAPLHQSDSAASEPTTGVLFEEEFAMRSDLRGPIYTNDQIIDEAFRWFREMGFPYRQLPKFVMMQQLNALAQTPIESLAQTVEAYSVADTFHPHRFHVTVDGKVSPFQCFHDDVKFRHALVMRRVLRNEDIPAGFFGELTLSRGTQQCSNFRPGFACWMYRRYCNKGATVLDTSTGYGGRLVGFLASRLDGNYIGIDPNTQTHHANRAMVDALGFADHVLLFNNPVEDLDPKSFEGQCDFMFSSPPYFSKEHYADEDTQSWKRYGHSFTAWVDGFLRPMLRLTFYSLKPGCLAIINIEDVKIRTVKYPLVQATVDAAVSVGFQCTGDESFKMQPRVGAHQDDVVAVERVLRFRKP